MSQHYKTTKYGILHCAGTYSALWYYVFCLASEIRHTLLTFSPFSNLRTQTSWRSLRPFSWPRSLPPPRLRSVTCDNCVEDVVYGGSINMRTKWHFLCLLATSSRGQNGDWRAPNQVSPTHERESRFVEWSDDHHLKFHTDYCKKVVPRLRGFHHKFTQPMTNSF